MSPGQNLLGYLFIAVWTHGYSFFSLGYNPILLLFVLLLKLFQWELLQVGSWFIQHLTCPIILLLLLAFYPFQHHKVLQAHLGFSLSQPWYQPAPTSFYKRRVLRNQDLGSQCAHCNWGVTADRAGVYVFILTHAYTHIYLFMYALICMYFLKVMVH